MNDLSVYFTVDTGAVTTIVSSSLYNSLPSETRPTLETTRALTSADGKLLNCLGRCTFNLELGSLKLSKELTVAAITDDVLLGSDILQSSPPGPADLLINDVGCCSKECQSLWYWLTPLVQ